MEQESETNAPEADYFDAPGDDDEENNNEMDTDDEHDVNVDVNHHEHSTVVSSVDVDGIGAEVRRIGTASEFIVQSSQASLKPKDKANTKPVECYDLQGNFIQVFKSGKIAALELNVQQSDISLCCRGLKATVGGYKFRFAGITEAQFPDGLKPKRGFAYVPIDFDTTKQETSHRTTRASRGEYGLNVPRLVSSSMGGSKVILAPSTVKSRKWIQAMMKAGPFIVQKWVPDRAQPTEALQAYRPKGERKKKSGGRKSSGF
jgi:hypothetical protein